MALRCRRMFKAAWPDALLRFGLENPAGRPTVPWTHGSPARKARLTANNLPLGFIPGGQEIDVGYFANSRSALRKAIFSATSRGSSASQPR